MSDFKQSAREPDFGPVLAAQRAYAASRTKRSRFGLMVPEAFVRGIRDIGYRSNGDAIAELIDNALQAYADRVDVLFGYEGTTSNKKPMQVAVVDNGHGMDATLLAMNAHTEKTTVEALDDTAMVCLVHPSAWGGASASFRKSPMGHSEASRSTLMRSPQAIILTLLEISSYLNRYRLNCPRLLAVTSQRPIQTAFGPERSS